MIEIAIVVSLLFGGLLGYDTAKHQQFDQQIKQTQVPQTSAQPKNWGPAPHQEGMLMCRSMCNKKVLEYNPLTGECICRSK